MQAQSYQITLVALLHLLTTHNAHLASHTAYEAYIDTSGTCIPCDHTPTGHIAAYVHIFPHTHHDNLPYTRLCGYDIHEGWIDVTALGSSYLFTRHQLRAVTQDSITPILQAEKKAICNERLYTIQPRERYFYILSHRLSDPHPHEKEFVLEPQ